MDSKSLAQFIDLQQSPTFFMYGLVPFWFIYMPFFLVKDAFPVEYKIWYAVTIVLILFVPQKTIVINLLGRNQFCCIKNKEDKGVKSCQRCLKALSKLDCIINFICFTVLSYESINGTNLLRKQKIENYFIPEYYSKSKFSVEVIFLINILQAHWCKFTIYSMITFCLITLAFQICTIFVLVLVWCGYLEHYQVSKIIKKLTNQAIKVNKIHQC